MSPVHKKGWRWRLCILTNSFTKIMTQLTPSPTLHRSQSHPHSHKKDLPGTGDSQDHRTEYSNLPDSMTWSIVYPSFIPSWPGHFSLASGPSSDLIINFRLHLRNSSLQSRPQCQCDALWASRHLALPAIFNSKTKRTLAGQLRSLNREILQGLFGRVGFFWGFQPKIQLAIDWVASRIY